jgi:hypothetical protein
MPFSLAAKVELCLMLGADLCLNYQDCTVPRKKFQQEFAGAKCPIVAQAKRISRLSDCGFSRNAISVPQKSTAFSR